MWKIPTSFATLLITTTIQSLLTSSKAEESLISSGVSKLYECAPGTRLRDFVSGGADDSIMTQRKACTWLKSRGTCSYTNALEMRQHTQFDLARLANISAILRTQDDSEQVKAQLREMAMLVVNATLLQNYHTFHHLCQHWDTASMDCLFRDADTIWQDVVMLCGRQGDIFDHQDHSLVEQVFKDHFINGEGPLPPSALQTLVGLLIRKFECIRMTAQNRCPGANRTLSNQLQIFNFYFNLSNYAELDFKTDDPQSEPKPLSDTVPAYFTSDEWRVDSGVNPPIASNATSESDPQEPGMTSFYSMENLLKAIKQGRLFIQESRNDN